MLDYFGMKNSHLNCLCCDMNDHMTSQYSLECNYVLLTDFCLNKIHLSYYIRYLSSISIYLCNLYFATNLYKCLMADYLNICRLLIVHHKIALKYKLFKFDIYFFVRIKMKIFEYVMY